MNHICSDYIRRVKPNILKENSIQYASGQAIPEHGLIGGLRHLQMLDDLAENLHYLNNKLHFIGLQCCGAGAG